MFEETRNLKYLCENLQKRCNEYQQRIQVAELKAEVTADLQASLNISEDRNKKLNEEVGHYRRKFEKEQKRADHAEMKLAKALEEFETLRKKAA